MARNWMGDYDPQNTTGWKEKGQVETWSPSGNGATTTSYNPPPIKKSVTIGGEGIASRTHPFLKKTTRANPNRYSSYMNRGPYGSKYGLQAIMNMPKYWSLPSDIRALIESGENIPISHGFESKLVKDAIKKGGFKNIRPQAKIPPTTDALEAATKALLKGNVKDAYTKLGQTKGAFTAIGPTAKEAAISARKYAKPASDISRGVGKLGSLKNIVQGVIDPRHGYIDRGMTGNLQGRWDTGAVNKALGLGSKSAQVAGKPIAQSLLNKIGARALPGANIALGGAAALGHLQAGNYGQAAMAGLSMIPGPVGYAGLAGELGLGALSRMAPVDTSLPQNTLVMNKGGIVDLYRHGGF